MALRTLSEPVLQRLRQRYGDSSTAPSPSTNVLPARQRPACNEPTEVHPTEKIESSDAAKLAGLSEMPLSTTETTEDAARTVEVAPATSDHLLRGTVVVTNQSYAFDTLGLVDRFVARAACLRDLPLENAKAEELEKIGSLRAQLLQHRGLAEEPTTGWTAQHFTSARLLCYLRESDGNLKKALARAIVCTECVDSGLEMARAYEAAPESFKTRWRASDSGGFFGRDRRGASVLWITMAQGPQSDVVRDTSLDFWLQKEWYGTLNFWYTLGIDSEIAGKCLYGRMAVIDVAGWSLSNAKKDSWLEKRVNAMWPGGEHPMPEGLGRPPLAMIICFNVPPAAEALWKVVRWLLPAHLVAGVRIFRRGQHTAFLKELTKWVEISQVPTEYGGTANVPFPYFVKRQQRGSKVSGTGSGRPIVVH